MVIIPVMDHHPVVAILVKRLEIQEYLIGSNRELRSKEKSILIIYEIFK